MKISVEPSLFADLVARAGHHTSGPIEPVLAGLLLEADGATMTVSAFNRESSFRATMPAEVAEPGKTLLPGRLLADAAKGLAKRHDFLQMASTTAETTITCGSAVMTIRALPADDFPALPQPAAAVGTVDAADLRDAVSQVAPACKPEKPVKPEHAVVRMDIDGDEITWVGADNYRMATRITPWNPGTPDARLAAHVPVRAFRDMVKDFGKGSVTLGVSDTLVSLASAEQTVTIGQYQIDEYTDYKPRLAKPLPTTVTVETEALLEAVKRVVLFAENQDVTLDIGPDEISVHAGDIAGVGRGADTVPCEVGGDTMTLRFQPPFLIDGLEGVHTEKTVIGMTAPGRYILISSTDQAFKYLAVPLRAR
ncbi:DNA polymerase III subunit beta [Nonomuraea sp. SYSU D8015]|uniref:DNA polymerase III subunit beta n=1 Tax=Nonomuraea sp. SYSU D8015 TaxID=2593644 RepID=UPI0016605D32|nr:hypothetical protein [Nonomuraea sp. SYSU D8015]